MSAILAGGSALLLCPPSRSRFGSSFGEASPALSESETSEPTVLALGTGSDCARDNDSGPAARWSPRLVADDSSPDSTDDDGDDAPDGVIATAPHRIGVALSGVLLAHNVLVSAYAADFDNRALRGPPEDIPSDSSQDSDDDDGDDAPDGVIAAETIRPADLEHTLFIRNDGVAAYAVDMDAHALRGPPTALPSDSSDVSDEERPALELTTSGGLAHQSEDRLLHALDGGHSCCCAFCGESLRAPP